MNFKNINIEKIVRKEFNAIISRYNYRYKKNNDNEIELKNNYLAIQILLYKGHLNNVSVVFIPLKHKNKESYQQLGLDFIIKVRTKSNYYFKRDFKNEKELNVILKKIIFELERYCMDIIMGDFSDWKNLEDEAYKIYKLKINDQNKKEKEFIIKKKKNELSSAFSEKNYKKVINISKELIGHLSNSEIKKVEYVKKLLKL